MDIAILHQASTAPANKHAERSMMDLALVQYGMTAFRSQDPRAVREDVAILQGSLPIHHSQDTGLFLMMTPGLASCARARSHNLNTRNRVARNVALHDSSTTVIVNH